MKPFLGLIEPDQDSWQGHQAGELLMEMNAVPAGDTLTLPHVSAVHFYVSSTTHSPLYQFLLPWSAFFYWPNKTLPIRWSISKDNLFHHAILCPSAPVSQSSGLYVQRVLSIFLWTSIRSIFKTAHSHTFKGPPHPYLFCFQHFFKDVLFSLKFWDSALDLHLSISLLSLVLI